MWFTLRYLYLATVVLCIEQPRVENVGGVKQSVHFRRAVDGTRGRKYFNAYEDGSYNDYGSSGGDYDSGQGGSGFSDIRGSVPGEPGVDYPVYTRVPTTRFSCEGRAHGYYADKEAGCQSFHVCHDVMISSFICPVGSTFSQELLTCDWWNRVDCSATEDLHTSHQRIYEDSNQMIQKAYAMIQLPVRNGVSNSPEIGVSRINNMNIGFGENGATNDRGRGSFATPLDRETDNYKITNFDIGRNGAAVTDENQAKQNIIKVNLRPQDFEVNYQGLNSRLNDRAKDSSIIYIGKTANDNSRGVYSTLRPATLQNDFQSSYQQNEQFPRNEFQPSYAPTVPTVTTTTRKLYSPTVPTTYRLATIPYNKYDQDLESSDHLYTHSRNINLLTTEPTIDYEDTRVEDDISSNPVGSQNKENEQSGYVDDTVANKGQYQENFAEIVQSEESTRILQSFDRNMNRGGDYNQKEAKNESETNLQSGASTNEDTYFSSSESNLGHTRTRFGTESSGLNSNISGNKRSYQHFYTDLVSVGSRYGEREIRKLNGILENNATDGTVKREDDDNSNLLSTQSRIPPLIVEIPRPSASSLGRPVVDIADQLFTFDSFINMSSSTTDTPPPVIPSKINLTNRINEVQGFDSYARIPPLIPQFSQSAASSGSQPSSGIGDNQTFSSPPRIPPLISEIPQSAELPGVDLSDEDVPIQTFDFSTRIPLLIPQSSQSVASTGSQSSTGVDDNGTLDSSPRIPPLASEIPQSVESPEMDSSNENDPTQRFDSPSRIPPLIPQFSQSAASSGSQSSSGLDGNEIFESPNRIPPLISQIPEFSQSPRIDSSDVDHGTQTFEFADRIPPLIPQPSQSAASSGPQSPAGIDDNGILDAPPRIPPLISELPQSAESSGVDSSEKNDRTQSFEFASSIPPLIPQSSQSAASPGKQSPTGINDIGILDKAPRIPPLISEIPQSVESPGVDSSDEDDPTQKFDSPSRIPPLIPQSSQPAASSSSQSLSGFDGNEIFESPTRTPPLISQIPEFSQSPGIDSSDVDHETQTFEFADTIPPLIPQSSQSAASSGSQSPSGIDDNKTFNPPPRMPPLISQIPQSVGSSGVDSSNKDDPAQSFEFASRIPPLIPQSSQSAASSGSQSPSGIDDNKIFNPPPRIPPSISQIPQSVGSSGVDSSNKDDPAQSFEFASSIPPLIPQSSQSAASSGTQSPSGIDDNKTFNPPPRIPPLISQIPQSVGLSGGNSLNKDDPAQSFEFASRIPPLIPQSSQSAASSGSQSPSGIDDNKTFNTPPRIPPLISQIPQSVGSSGVDSSNKDDPTQSFEFASSILPLIPQSSQSAASSGSQSPSGIDDNKIFNPPPRIPPSISQIPQSVGSSGVDASNKDDPTQSFEFASSIPPLIPQSSQSAASSGTQSPSGIDDNKTFNPPPRIPPLISQIPQSVGLSGGNSLNKDDPAQSFEFASRIPPLIPQSSQSAASSGSQSPSGIDDNKTFNTPPRIPPLISQIPQSVGSSGVDSSNKDDPTQSFEFASSIPPLIPQSSQSAASSGSQSPSGIDDNKIFNPPPRIPPSISQIPQSIGLSGGNSLNKDDPAQSFEFASRIPPLIPQSSQSAASSGSQSPSGIDDKKTFNPPPRIPPLIPEIPQSVGSSGVNLLNKDDPTQSFEFASRIPPLIPQSSQSAASSGSQSPSGIDDNKTFNSPPRIPPLISQISQSVGSPGVDSFRPIISQAPQFFGTLGVNSPTGIHQTHIVKSSTKIPELNSQPFQSIGTSKGHPSHRFGEKHISIAPPRLPTFNSPIWRPLVSPGTHSTGVLDPKQTSDPSINKPFTIPQHSQHIHAAGTYSYDQYNSFKLSPGTEEAAHFTFLGQHQRPPSFTSFNVPTRRPEHPFGSTSAYDFSLGYGSRPSTKETIVNPLGHLPDSIIQKFRINVPDFPSTKESQFTQSTSLPTTRNPYLSGISTSESLGSQEHVGIFTEKPFIASSNVNQSPVEVSNVGSLFPTADYPQLSVTDRPKIAFASLPPKNHSYSQISTGNNENKHTHTVVKPSTLFPPSKNEDHSNYNFFKQALAPNPSISDTQKPISTDFGPGNWPKNNDNPQFTIRGALQYPTTTPFTPFNTITPAYLPQSAGSSADATGQKFFSSKYSNTGDRSTYESHPENLSYNKNQDQNTTPRVVETSPSAGNNFIPTSSHSPVKDSGYSNGQFEFTTPTNILDTTSIKSAENHDTKGQEILQTIGTDSFPPGFSQIEASLNNDDAPYEVSFTVNGDEDFHPSADFINKLLAQHESNFSLGFAGLEGYEIIKSEDPGYPDNADIAKPAPLTNIESSVAPTVMRIFDVRGSFDQRTAQTNGFFNQNSNSGTPKPKVGETHATKIEPLKPDDLPRPFFFGNDHSVVLPSQRIFESNTLFTTKPPVLDSNLWNGKPQDSLYLPELQAKDINISLESLFESVSETPTSSPLRKEDILEQLTVNFGQPLYNNNNNPQRYFISPEASRNVNHNAGRQFDSIEQYRVGKNDASNKDPKPTSSVPPPTTSTTTPEPVKTFVETEFIPSLGFSFDSDEGRNEYVEAILQGLLTDHRSLDPWTDDADDDAYRVSRENSKSKNETTEIK